MADPLRALIVEDSSDAATLIVGELARQGYDVRHQRVQTAEEMRRALGAGTWDVVLSDYMLSAFCSQAALDVLRERGIDLPFVVVSGTTGEETAVAVLMAGAHDFLVKGRLARLAPVIEKEMRDARERHERLQADQGLHSSEAAFRSLVEHAVVGICQATLDGRFLAVNSSLASMLGYPSAEALVAAGLAQVWGDANVGADLLARTHQSGRFAGEEVVWRGAKGQAVHVRLSGCLIDMPNASPAVEVIVEDVTERHRLQGQLRQGREVGR